jgi:hypothetical protein
MQWGNKTFDRYSDRDISLGTIHWEIIIVMEDKDAVISTLESLNLKFVKEVSKL